MISILKVLAEANVPAALATSCWSRTFALKKSLDHYGRGGSVAQHDGTGFLSGNGIEKNS